MRVDSSHSPFPNTELNEESGLLTVKADTQIVFRFFGTNFTPNSTVVFTTKAAPLLSDCVDTISGGFQPVNDSISSGTSALFTVTLSANGSPDGEFNNADSILLLSLDKL
jgi:hypothetical protein